MSVSEITTGYKERFPDAVRTLCQCFNNDPVLTFILNNRPREQRLEYLPKLFHVLIKAAILNDAIVTELDDYQACAIWVPPGKKVDNWATNFQAGFLTVLWDLGFYGVRQMLLEYQGVVDAIKKPEIAKYSACYYLYFVGTLPESQGKGHGTKLIEHWQERASVEDAAIWLEATTPGSHRLYQRLGFRDVKDLTLGKGKAAADGTHQVDGPGVPLWTMIWTPTAKVKADDSS